MLGNTEKYLIIRVVIAEHYNANFGIIGAIISFSIILLKKAIRVEAIKINYVAENKK